jgi:hypothetical protein
MLRPPSGDQEQNMNDDLSKKSAGTPNLDPISGTPGAHPVGTGIGAAAGGMAAGAAVGTVAGPVGTAVGAAVGAIVGGLAGKGVAESIDPTVEDTYWRHNYKSRPYVRPDSSYDDFGPAYTYGVSVYAVNIGRSYDDLEKDMSAGWDKARGTSRLSWNDARIATRDAWDRVSGSVEE